MPSTDCESTGESTDTAVADVSVDRRELLLPVNMGGSLASNDELIGPCREGRVEGEDGASPTLPRRMEGSPADKIQ